MSAGILAEAPRGAARKRARGDRPAIWRPRAAAMAVADSSALARFRVPGSVLRVPESMACGATSNRRSPYRNGRGVKSTYRGVKRSGRREWSSMFAYAAIAGVPPGELTPARMAPSGTRRCPTVLRQPPGRWLAGRAETFLSRRLAVGPAGDSSAYPFRSPPSHQDSRHRGPESFHLPAGIDLLSPLMGHFTPVASTLFSQGCSVPASKSPVTSAPLR